ncbi:uncharacterized protein [Oryza sativa Japonica Group]|uniref:Os05g0136100 protein n=1 Tax=Oryza sativa subsp. japonica TaxID=39947 RepID=A0A0P0WHQ0_ORYSJ|nr:uncharacterized protein LOC9267386 isoform X1 [Oryza sativa Japonica Group]BAS92154.1 Os05g0136100 [Oryza sativa Japonica Group]
MPPPPPMMPTGGYPGHRGCGGDRCGSGRDAWPLHNVRHQGVFCRLCSSCVLLYHPAAFCSACLLLLPPAAAPVAAPPGPVSACSSCGLFVAHHSCVPDPVSFVCPTCADAAVGRVYSYTPAAAAGRRRTMDERAARVLLVAARLAHESISRAAAAAREEADRAAREAAVARKHARELLDAACRAAEPEALEAKKKAEAPVAPAAAPPPPPPQPKKKAPPKSSEASRDRDNKPLKLTATQQPALAFAAAAAAAASSMPLSMPSPMEVDEKPVIEELQGEQNTEPATTLIELGDNCSVQ